MAEQCRILIIDSPYYEDIVGELLAGAVEALDAAGAHHDRISVPGVLEIPAALSIALEAALADNANHYDGFVLLGCVIRGETSHYDIVANESARAVMDLTVELGLALGNGILTVENRDQAWARASRTDKNKGAFAANAALAMCDLRQQLLMGA